MIELTTSYQLIKQEYVGNAYGDVYVRCYAKYDEQDIPNNRTKVTVASNLVCAGTWWSQSGNEWYAGATGLTTASGTAPSSYSPGEITLGTLTGWISHENDGTKQISVAAGFVSTPWGFAKTANDTVKLPDIPRASKINSITNSISSDGNTVKVNVNFTKYASSFYQQLVLMTVGRTETIATFNGVISGTDYSLDATARQKLYNWIGTSLDNKAVICDLKTYSSSAMTTLVGTYSDLTYFKLPTYSLSFTTSSVEDSVTTYDTYKPNSNTYIANLSKPKYTFSASSSTGSTYGRSIGYSIGSTSVTSPYTNNNYTGQSLTITASDGRRSATTTPSMTHVAYFRPTLTTKVTRTTPTGSTATVTVNGTFYDGTNLTNLETEEVQFVYTESGGTQQTITIPITTSTSGTVTSFNGTATLTNLNYKKIFNWSCSIYDKLGVSTSNTGLVPEGQPLWNGYKKNDENYFNINGKLLVDNKPTKYEEHNIKISPNNPSSGKWQCICNIKFNTHNQGEFSYLKIFLGNGNNGDDNQNAYIELVTQLGWAGSLNGRAGCNAVLHAMKSAFSTNNTRVKVISNSNTDYNVWVYSSKSYCRMNYISNTSDNVVVTSSFALSDNEPTGTACNCSYIQFENVYLTDETTCGYYLGKPLYRIVIGMWTVDGENVGPTFTNIDRIVRLDGSYQGGVGSGNSFQLNTFINNDYYIKTWLWHSSANTFILYNNAKGYTGYDGHIIIEYTKTTD